MMPQALKEIATPSFVIDEEKLRKNCEILQGVMERTGCKILLAQKCFSGFALYPLIGEYLSGTTASGLFEAKLGREEMNKENHIFSPAYRDEDFPEILSLCDHIIFNSVRQMKKYLPACQKAGVSTGLRVNPRCSTQDGHAIYDPCAPGSRLGVPRDQLTAEDLQGVDGLHFHTLCEQNSDDLQKTLLAFEEQFGEFLPTMKWVNFGGGHHITREDYDLKTLEDCIQKIQKSYQVQVYLEPGEAVALNAGLLITEVLDIVETDGLPVLILDTSASCHMPDVLEMPYRPPLRHSGEPHEKYFTYRLSSCTCLAGDVIGDYSFDTEIHIGDRLILEDMAIYSMVKTNTFNGMPLPSIYRMDKEGNCHLIRQFDYADFKGRLS